MSLTLRRPGRPSENGADPRRGVVPARPGAQLAARIGLWGLVGLGAVGGLVGLLRPSSPETTATAEGDGSGTVPVEVAGFAEVAVTAWLEFDGGDRGEEELDALYAVDPPSAASDTGRRRVGVTNVVGARPLGEHYWAVTVAAPVDEYVEERWRAAGTWYLEVGVVAEGGTMTAVTEPALVPAPAAPEEPPRPAGGGLGVPGSDDEAMAATVQGFLAALVAGDGDVSRYLAPDVEIVPVTPAPFAEVTLQRWAVEELGDDQARVRVSARGVSAGGVPRTVNYELGLAQRAGRWEVTSLSGAPTLHDEDGRPAPTTAGSSTTAPAVTTTSPSIASEPGA